MNQVKTTSGKFTPPQFSEVILKTARFAAMKAWYETVTDVNAFFVRNDAKQPNWTGAYNIAFIRIFSAHPYTQVLGLFEVPAVSGQAENQKGEPGLHHMQLRHAGLDHLFSRYEALRALGITPFRSFNHGPGTSFYYHDPDGNTVELSSANFVDEADYLAYFRSETFAKNISGIEIDPAAYVARFRAGTPQEELVRF
jgi:catechol 2,3-dioxygenase-like lactoylglutathione lyase family enzyme